MKEVFKMRKISISHFYDNDWIKFSFRAFRHKKGWKFDCYNNVIEFTIFYHNFCIEF